MYSNSAAAPRADISVFLEEAVESEKYFVGQRILPVFPSNTQSGRYPKIQIGPGELLRRESTKRAPSGSYNEVDRQFTWDTFQTLEYGLEERVDDVVAKQMRNFFDAEVLTGKYLMRALMLDYEVEVAAAVMDPTTFTVLSAGTAYTEANLATFDFPKDWSAASEKLTTLGEGYNVAIMSLQVFNRIRRSTKTQLYLYGSLSANSGARLVTAQNLADAMGVEEVIVTKQNYNLAAKGQTKSLGPIWGNDYIFVGKIASGDWMNGGIGRTIIWDADSPNGLFATETYRREERRGNMVRVRSNRTQKIINPNAGVLIPTTWS